MKTTVRSGINLHDAAPLAAMLPHVKDILRHMGVTQALPDAQLLPIITGCGGDLRVLLPELERLRNALARA